MAQPEDWAALSPGAPDCLSAHASPSPFAEAALPQRPAPSLQLRVLSSRSGARGSLTSAPNSAATFALSAASASSCSTPTTAAGSAGGGRKRLSWWDDYEDRKRRGAYTPLTSADTSIPSSPGGFDDCYYNYNSTDEWEDTKDDADEGDDLTNRKSSGFEEMTIVEDGVAVRDLLFPSPGSSFHDDDGEGRRRSSSVAYGHRRSSSGGSTRLLLLQLERRREGVAVGRRIRLAVVGGGLGLFMLLCVLYALSWIAG